MAPNFSWDVSTSLCSLHLFGDQRGMVALVSGIIKRVVFADWTVSSFLGTREVVRSGWELGGPGSYPTHSGPEFHHFGSHDLSQWLSLSASTFPSVGKGEWSAQCTCPESPRSEDECHPHRSLEPRPHLSLRPFSGIVLCGEAEATSPLLSPSPTPRNLSPHAAA